ncbi:hypothetical protein MNBD_GAMMA22-598 [hydrothermal vent metagenome]|uniref:Uncharacterized protein n=1 Tax=hydrothermal vent metagenome TaxID=652676 RepID=A0A3B1A001_9ZZZZ
MHPVIRISIFLIFCYFIVQAKPGQLLLAGFILLSVSVFQAKKYSALMWNMIWRLKWFYLSIFLLFSWLTPNTIALDSENILFGLSAGVSYSLYKITVLILIVMSVILFIVAIPRDELIAAIVFLSKPLSIFGFSSEKFAVRVFLIVEFVELLPAIIASYKISNMNNSKIKKIVLSLEYVISEVYHLAENSECKKIQYDNIQLPRYYQWGYLLISIALFYISDVVYIQIFGSA